VADIHVCGLETRLDALFRICVFMEFSCFQDDKHRDESRCGSLKGRATVFMDIISTLMGACPMEAQDFRRTTLIATVLRS
jgi:hypothetical protein